MSNFIKKRGKRMRKLIAQTVVSIDGYFEGPNRMIDWHLVDHDYSEYAADLLSSVETILFGRKTYELMAGYWPTSEAYSKDPAIAKWMNEHQKVVFSRTLECTDWQNTRIVKSNIADEIQTL